MANPIVKSQGYDQDIAAVTDDKLVLLHRWAGGHILLMSYDAEMPDWTVDPAEPPSDDEIVAKILEIEANLFAPTKGEKYATGYVFRVYEERSNGHLEFEGRSYTPLEIYDYVVWTDERQVRQKYHEVVARARLEQ